MAAPTPNQLEVWLEGFPREEAVAKIRELERELVRWRNALTLYDSMGGQRSNGTEALPEQDVEGPPNRPEAIRQILRNNENKPMTPAQIKDAMLENGWLPDSQQHLKRFYAALSTMKQRGHLLRLQDGRYVLPGGAPM